MKISKPACRQPSRPPSSWRTFGIAEAGEAAGSLGHKAVAGIVNDDRHILARQPRLGLDGDAAGRHIGGEQRMTGGKGGLVAQVEQRDFLTQQQHVADLRRGNGGDVHGTWLGGTGGSLARSPRTLRPAAPGAGRLFPTTARELVS